jgi:hypothetical protein
MCSVSDTLCVIALIQADREHRHSLVGLDYACLGGHAGSEQLGQVRKGYVHITRLVLAERRIPSYMIDLHYWSKTDTFSPLPWRIRHSRLDHLQSERIRPFTRSSPFCTISRPLVRRSP